MKTSAVDALRVLGGEKQARCAAEREADDHGALGPGRVHHRRARRPRTRARRTPSRPLGGPSARCRVRRTRRRGSGARGTGSASSSGASGRSTTSAAAARSARPSRRPRRRCGRRRARRSPTRPGSAPASARATGVVSCDSHRSIQSSSSAWPASMPPSRSTMIPMLNVITSETSASSGISIPSSRARLCERLGQHGAPLGVHAREALAQLGVVPGQRLQLEPDLLVGDVLAHQVAHRRPPLLDERHVGRVQLALARDQPLGEALERPHQQVLDRAEVVVDEAVVDARLLGEPARRDARVADVDEQPLGGVEQRLLGRRRGCPPSLHQRCPQPDQQAPELRPARVRHQPSP